MVTATITPDQEAVIVEVFIAAPPERVFHAISEPEQLSRWWGENGRYRITERTVDLHEGGRWWCAGVFAGGVKFSIEGEYLEIDPPRRLVHTWIASYQGPLKTTVYWDLEPQAIHGLHPSGPKKAGTGTLVKLRHEGFVGPKDAALSHGEGWKRVFHWLQAYVERSETVDTRKQP